MDEEPMVDVALARIVQRDHAEQQYIYLSEREGKRGFPIVIGAAEAGEIHRVVSGFATQRPLTHQLAYASIQALGSSLARVDIVSLRKNTFYAELVLRDSAGELRKVDARPSDAIALALRARCPIRVAETVLKAASTE